MLAPTAVEELLFLYVTTLRVPVLLSSNSVGRAVLSLSFAGLEEILPLKRNATVVAETPIATIARITAFEFVCDLD